LTELHRARGLTMLIATHHTWVAQRCERTLELADGAVVADRVKAARGPPR
jgi:predicted ABC-type transport system involved in lysophospholipase L1 biosynthesis ATPase subunit